MGEAKDTSTPSKADAAVHLKTQKLLDRAVHEREGRAVPVGIAYFTRKAAEDRARRLAEARARHLENMSDAHRHFANKSLEKKLQAEKNKAGPAAVDHVPAKEKREQPLRGSASTIHTNEGDLMEVDDAAVHPGFQKLHGHSVPVGVAYFTRKAEEDRARHVAGARAEVPFAVSYFTKKAEEDRARHVAEARAEIPFAVAYFTQKAEEDKARRLAEARELHLKSMSDAHRHFAKKSMEKSLRSHSLCHLQ